MDILDRQTLVALSRPAGWPAVSIYLPMHRAPRETAEDRLRFKNLVRQALERLVAEGMRDADAEAFIAPLHRMRDDDSFWRTTGEGLAVFRSSWDVTALHLQSPMPEQIVVGDRFYVRPLVTVHLENDHSFYALALDKNGSRLFKGDAGTIEQMALVGAPFSEADSAKYDEPTKLGYTAPFAASRKHAGNRAATGGQFPGHGAEPSYEKTVMNGYVRQLSDAVDAAIGKRPGHPLILLGTERIVAEFRQITGYPLVADGFVEGTTDYLTPQMVHQRSLSALQPYFDMQEQAELTEVTENEGTELVTHDAEKIAEAAAIGRVRALFIDDAKGPFGTLDRESMTAKAVCEMEPRLLREQGDEQEMPDGECGWDLIDLAVAETVLHDGEVHAYTGENAPVHGAVALLRY